MSQLTTETVLWDEKKTAMGMEIPQTPVPMTVDGLQTPICPFSLGSPESSPPPSPSPSPAQRNEKQGEREKEGKGDSSSVGSVVVGPSGSNNNTTNTNTNTNTHLTELAAALARALSYTEGYDLNHGKQTQQGMNDVYELQTLTRYLSVRAARHHQPVGVEDSYCPPRPISRKVRAERRTRRYALV